MTDVFYGFPRDPIKDCPDDCIYKVHSGAIDSCDYVLANYEKRGCPGGKDCLKYQKGTGQERKGWTDRKLRFF